MNIEQLNFRHLFYFWQVAKTGHLTQAAMALHTSQSALSAQIKQLEERLGAPLFTRDKRKLVLTELGHTAFGYAETIFGLSQEMLSNLAGESSGTKRLRVGAVATMSRNYQENWIKPLLQDPSTLLTLESGLLPDLLNRLHTYQLDIVLANEPVPTDPEKLLHCQFLGREKIALVGPGIRWQPASLQIPEDLEGLEMALPSPRHAIRVEFDVMCQNAGVTPKLRAEVDDMAMLRLIARDSGWLTFLPEVVVLDELKQGLLVRAGKSIALTENFYAITKPNFKKTSLS
ncbi:MAG: LysR family transcriptional regulator [Limnobacter sp.]|nr:LysR family transcriptional regulator [Limnobacter sp.]